MFGQGQFSKRLPVMVRFRWAPAGSGLPLPPGAMISIAGRRQPEMTLSRIYTSQELEDSNHQNSGATSTAAIQP